MIAIGLALAALVGIALGLLGGGGSILTVPIFVYILDYDPKQAIAMSLAVVGVVSLFGTLSHFRAGNVNLRIALIFGPVAMVGTYLGARLAVFVSGTFQLGLFAVVMIAAAIFMFRGPRAIIPQDGAPKEPMRLGLIIAEGLVVGVL